MWQVLSKLQKNLVWSIPISASLGLLFGYMFDAQPLKQFIIPVTFVMVYPMMATLNANSVFKGGDYRIQIAAQLINFVLIPLLSLLIGKFFFPGGSEKFRLWAVGLFLMGVLPTSGMTISWTGFAGGNKEAAIKMVVLGLILGSLAAPVYTKVFMGATVDVDVLHMFKQIALFVFVPLFAGLLTQYYAKKRYGVRIWNQQLKPKFPAVSALGVTLIAFVAMSLKAKHIIANPGDIVTILIPVIVFYVVAYVLLSLTGKLFFSRDDAIAMVFGVVMRNLSIALAIAMTAFGRQGVTIALLISLAYIVQIQSAAWYVRFVETIFGKAPGKPERPQEKRVADRPAVVSKLPTPLPQPGASVVPDIQRILYATDLSDTARHAVRYACSIGSRYGAEVTVLHVIPDVLEELSTESGIDLAQHLGRGGQDFNKKGIEKAKAIIQQRIRETSRQVTQEIPHCPLTEDKIIIKVGNPVQQIVETAEEGEFDLVVMGTHGHGKIEAAITGSIARGVIRQCSKPVMVVRLPEATAVGKVKYPHADLKKDDDRQALRKLS